MEKKGDMLNQLALIADLLERVNLTSKDPMIIFDVEREEFNRIYNTIYLKAKSRLNPPKDTFNLQIGDIKIIFNTNSV